MVENGFMLLGAFIIAVILIIFCWHLVAYVFFKGDDAHRIHAKNGIISISITLVFVLILWWLFELVAASFA